MSTYVNDTFTDTNGTAIASHTPDVGGAWTSDQSGLAIQSNQLQGSAFSDARARNATTPATADYEVSIDVVMVNTTASASMVGVQARSDGAGLDGYEAYYDGGAGQVKLRKWVGFNPTALGSSNLTYVQGQTHNVKLRVQGTTITVFVDNTQQIQVTDASVSAINKAGIWINGGNGASQMVGDNFLCADIVIIPVDSNKTIQRQVAARRPAPFQPMGGGNRNSGQRYH